MMGMTARLLTVCGLFFLLSSCTFFPRLSEGNESLPKRMQPGFVYLDAVAPKIKVDLKYAGSDNFIGRPLKGYQGRRAILRIETALALKAVSDDFNKQGYVLVLYDAYRPHTAVEDICRWGKDLSDRKMKGRYYPNIDKSRIFEDKYVGPFSEHSCGIAVDVSLLYAATGKPVDMGGHHDFLDPSSATTSLLVTPEQRKNRLFMRRVFNKHGFANYRAEWWHYWLKNSPYNTLCYSFPIWDGML